MGIEGKKEGRPQAVTVEQIKEAIRKLRTRSDAEIARELRTSIMSVWRRKKEIPEVEIEAILKGVAEGELTPKQLEYDVFVQLPEMQELKHSLEVEKKVSPTVQRSVLRGLHSVIRQIKIRPKDLTPEMLQKLWRERKVKLGDYEKYAIRTFFERIKGISGEKLTILGFRIEAKEPVRARIRLTAEERHRFLEAIINNATGVFQPKKTRRIDFNEPLTAEAMIHLPKFLYYSGARIEATLEADWANMHNWEGKVPFLTVIDKGVHRKGRKTWDKKFIGEWLEEWRDYYKRLGEPKEGRIFPFDQNQTRTYFVHCYKEAKIPPEGKWEGMPHHVWRHTGAQDLLDATDWNYGVVAQILGWESDRILKRHYGAMPSEFEVYAMKKAMGEVVEEREKRAFVF